MKLWQAALIYGAFIVGIVTLLSWSVVRLLHIYGVNPK